MSPWIRWIFIDILPPIIRVSRPKQHAPKYEYKTRVQKEREKFLKRSTYSAATMDSDQSPFGEYDDTPFEGREFRPGPAVFAGSGTRNWKRQIHRG